MTKVIILQGIPASGKTTFAKEYQKRNPGTKRVNRDELRAMLDDSVWSRENEEFIVAQEEFLVQMALLDKHDVIIDDTNLAPKTIAMWERLIEQHNSVQHACEEDLSAEIEYKIFDTSLDECIRRDSNRKGRAHVGKGVVKKFHDQYAKSITQAKK